MKHASHRLSHTNILSIRPLCAKLPLLDRSGWVGESGY
jgi:hypothetical protein